LKISLLYSSKELSSLSAVLAMEGL